MPLPSRRPAAAPARTAAPTRGVARPAPRTSSGYSGDEGMRRMEIEQANAAARREAATAAMDTPFRFFCPVGDTRQFIIVDEKPDFFRYEHALQNNRTQKWDIYCACIAEHANCPVDKVATRPAYYAMYLTVIDLTPYVNSEGIEIPWSKKLLVVKIQQQKKFVRMYQQHGTLRGALIQTTRDTKKDSAIGNDIEYLEHVPEEELLTYETDYPKKDGSTKLIIGHEACDYAAMFPMPTEQSLRAIVGGQPEPGSREEAGRALGRRPAAGASGDDWDGEEGEEGEEAAPPPRRGAPPARTARTVAAAPSRTVTRTTTRVATRAAPVEDPEEELEDEPPQRTARVATRTAPAAPVRRAAPPPAAPVRRGPIRPAAVADEEEDEDEQAAAPQTLADKRRALRR